MDSNRRRIASVTIVLHLVFAAITWRDIARRSSAEIRGPKGVWRAASAINSLGSIVYWTWGRTRARAHSGVVDIPLDECWALLRDSPVGRLVTLQLHVEGREDGLDIFPLNYLVHDNAVYFRSGPGSKLMEIAQHHTVAFEVDGHRGNTHWSVVVHGRAERLGMDFEIENSGVLELSSVHPDEKWNFVRITPEAITGRRFHHHPHRPVGVGG
ncbi:MAG: pyridoxamine 5'-phosphate oxidase family protein [Salinibacterium sp.]|nr:pyridoxamine 5'-phosphate oxidase family protein [Salinibacterium sp.]